MVSSIDSEALIIILMEGVDVIAKIGFLKIFQVELVGNQAIL